MTYLPPRIPNPKKDAERRAHTRSVAMRTLLWGGAAVLLLFAAMLYGYSDQAPASVRNFTIGLDNVLGRPVWRIIGPGGS